MILLTALLLACSYHSVSSRNQRSVNDVVSKNITMVLENLLKNYERTQLPTHNTVWLGEFCCSMWSNNLCDLKLSCSNHTNYSTTYYNKTLPTKLEDPQGTVENGLPSESTPVKDYSMDCYFRQTWRDSRLSFKGPIKSLSLSIKMLERIWRPDTYFYNGKQSYVHTITVPNKLLRISQDGDILYSMRLTIKAKCPMELRSFPMDRQSCPLILGSYAYPSHQLIYQWQTGGSVSFEPGMTLSQFDLMGSPQRNLSFHRREGTFSLLQVNFNLQRHTGYFLIQVYVPCILIVVLSWVSFWIHREATSDRVGLGITTVLTLSTISLDSRTDLPKVKYATALDWFLLMSFFYCIATLLEFAGVHYFTKVGSGEIPIDEDEWEDLDTTNQEVIGVTASELGFTINMDSPTLRSARRRSSLICPIYNDPTTLGGSPRRLSIAPVVSTRVHAARNTVERQTQTETKVSKWTQMLYCIVGDDAYRKKRQREASQRGPGQPKHVNSVSYIDRAARILFPASFTFLNIAYWMLYFEYQAEFGWHDIPSVSH